MTRWTQSDVDAVLAKRTNWSAAATKRAHKFHAKGTDVDGIHFASKLEARCYREQKLRVAAKEVRFFLRQVPFRLPGGVTYWCDFFCVLESGWIEVIDAKGVDTAMSRLKRKQVLEIYGVEVKLWTDKANLGYRRLGSEFSSR